MSRTSLGGSSSALGPPLPYVRRTAVPQGAQVIDGTGLSVYPGMMDVGTSMGLNEISQGANATVDDTEVGSFNPNAIGYYAMNPHSAHIGVTRVVGVTHVLSSPTDGIVSGQATLANLGGRTAAAMTIQQKAGLVITLPRRWWRLRVRRRRWWLRRWRSSGWCRRHASARDAARFAQGVDRRRTGLSAGDGRVREGPYVAAPAVRREARGDGAVCAW